NPLFLKYIFDEGVIRGDFPRFVALAVAFIAAATAWRALNLHISLRTQRLKAEALSELVERLLGRFYAAPYGSVAGKPPATHASRLYDEPAAAVHATVDLGMDLVGASVNAVAAFAVILSVSPAATAGLVLVVPGLTLLARRFGARIRRTSEDEKEGEGRLRAVLVQAAGAHRSVNSFGLLGRVRARAADALNALLGHQSLLHRDGAVYGAASTVLTSYSETLVLIVCGYQMLRGEMTFGGFMAFINAFWIALGGVRSLAAKLPDISRTAALADRLEAFEAPGAPAAPTADGRVELDGVHFGYGGAEALAGLSLSIAPGERVLLSGANGCGKSTAANIAAGFLAPSKGSARTFPPARVSATVTPHGFIPGTLRENIAYDDMDEAGRRRAAAVLAELGLTEQLDRDPLEMSAGQRKKAEVAMGVLKDADLYIFDEPLANVDDAGKAPVMRLILEAARGKSLAVIMHGDPEFAPSFDRTVRL
ncbi:MAG: ABC transporter, partial [Elusimicrobia bacterium]